MVKLSSSEITSLCLLYSCLLVRLCLGLTYFGKGGGGIRQDILWSTLFSTLKLEP